MPHAFHADCHPTDRKEAAEDGWTRMLAWFKKHGVACREAEEGGEALT